MKKGQVEIIGLMVIVILIIVIAFIFIRISTTPEKKDVIRENVEVTNLLNAMMKMTPCESIYPRDSMVDIVLECETGVSYCGMDCKSYIKQEIENVMDNLGKERYEFNIKKNGVDWLNVGSCGGDVFSDKYVNPGFIAQLMLC